MCVNFVTIISGMSFTGMPFAFGCGECHMIRTNSMKITVNVLQYANSCVLQHVYSFCIVLNMNCNLLFKEINIQRNRQ